MDSEKTRDYGDAGEGYEDNANEEYEEYDGKQTDERSKGEKTSTVMREVFDWAKHIVIAVVVGILFIVFVGQRTEVHGISMTPTLTDGDQLIIEKITPRFGTIKRGDIVTIYVKGLIGENKEYLIKRVIAVEGDEVRIVDGEVYVNNEQLDEGYINGDYTYEERLTEPEIVEEGNIFVMGDNRLRGGSNDSRSLGQFKVKDIGGRAIFRWYPFDKAGVLK